MMEEEYEEICIVSYADSFRTVDCSNMRLRYAAVSSLEGVSVAGLSSEIEGVYDGQAIVRCKSIQRSSNGMIVSQLWIETQCLDDDTYEVRMSICGLEGKTVTFEGSWLRLVEWLMSSTQADLRHDVYTRCLRDEIAAVSVGRGQKLVLVTTGDSYAVTVGSRECCNDWTLLKRYRKHLDARFLVCLQAAAGFFQDSDLKAGSVERERLIKGKAVLDFLDWTEDDYYLADRHLEELDPNTPCSTADLQRRVLRTCISLSHIIYLFNAIEHPFADLFDWGNLCRIAAEKHRQIREPGTAANKNIGDPLECDLQATRSLRVLLAYALEQIQFLTQEIGREEHPPILDQMQLDHPQTAENCHTKYSVFIFLSSDMQFDKSFRPFIGTLNKIVNAVLTKLHPYLNLNRIDSGDLWGKLRLYSSKRKIADSYPKCLPLFESTQIEHLVVTLNDSCVSIAHSHLRNALVDIARKPASCQVDLDARFYYIFLQFETSIGHGLLRINRNAPYTLSDLRQADLPSGKPFWHRSSRNADLNLMGDRFFGSPISQLIQDALRNKRGYQVSQAFLSKKKVAINQGNLHCVTAFIVDHKDSGLYFLAIELDTLQAKSEHFMTFLRGCKLLSLFDVKVSAKWFISAAVFENGDAYLLKFDGNKYSLVSKQNNFALSKKFADLSVMTAYLDPTGQVTAYCREGLNSRLARLKLQLF